MDNIELLKNAIDWKFFNYLKDKITSFEDKGCEVDIEINAPFGNKGYKQTVYRYRNNTEDYVRNINVAILKLNKLSYVITIYGSARAELEDLYNSIKHKCELRHSSNHTYFIEVLPKSKDKND